MKFLVTFTTIILAVQATKFDLQFNSFVAHNKKSYQSAQETQLRSEVFENNLNIIEEHNKKFEQGLVSYKLAVNKFSDLTKEEFIAKTLNLAEPFNISTFQNAVVYTANETNTVPRGADSIDWRNKGAVTGVKNQGGCGSCWTFSATGSLEGAYFIKTNQLLSFSEQNLLDCVTDNWGCGGGWPSTAFDYIYNNGITTEDKYPYTGTQVQCQNYDVVTKIFMLGVVKEDDENSLTSAVFNNGPVSVAIDASGFQQYSSGVFDNSECSKNSFNHAVTVVGFGSENGKDYYICKNSWGPDWGDNGYIKMSRNKDNQCGIASKACFPYM